MSIVHVDLADFASEDDEAAQKLGEIGNTWYFPTRKRVDPTNRESAASALYNDLRYRVWTLTVSVADLAFHKTNQVDLTNIEPWRVTSL